MVPLPFTVAEILDVPLAMMATPLQTQPSILSPDIFVCIKKLVFFPKGWALALNDLSVSCLKLRSAVQPPFFENETL